jgi:hypothetical protein
MAIETTYFTGTTAAANYAEVSAWLTVNAVDYFDTIDVPSGGQEVNCKVGDVTALKLDWSAEFATQRAFKITAKNGVVIDNGYFFNFDRCVWRRGVKTSNGIMLCNGSTDSFQTSLLVSRNSEGGIIFALVSPDNTNVNGSANRGRIIDFENSLNVITTHDGGGSSAAGRHAGMGIISAGRTALVPIVSDVETYCDKIMITPFSQYNNMCWGVIDVSGTKYVYNGVFALKE